MLGGVTAGSAESAEGSQVKVLILLHGVAFCCISAMGRELQKRTCRIVGVVEGVTFSLIFPGML